MQDCLLCPFFGTSHAMTNAQPTEPTPANALGLPELEKKLKKSTSDDIIFLALPRSKFTLGQASLQPAPSTFQPALQNQGLAQNGSWLPANHAVPFKETRRPHSILPDAFSSRNVCLVVTSCRDIKHTVSTDSYDGRRYRLQINFQGHILLLGIGQSILPRLLLLQCISQPANSSKNV